MTTTPVTDIIRPAAAPGATTAPRPEESGSGDGLREVLTSVWAWPWAVKGIAAALAAVYSPLLVAAGREWLNDDKQAHGVFVLPIVAGLLWLSRGDIRAAHAADSAATCGAPRRAAAGLTLLGGALAVETFAHLLGLQAVPLATLPAALLGAVLALCGRKTARAVLFPLAFLLFTVPVPDAITLPLSAHIQRMSTDVAAFALTTTGMPIAQNGNHLATPTLSVEVAEVCSGFKKLTALLAFSLLYGHVFGAGWVRRLLLLAATYPIALAANGLRICALVAIGTARGQHALEAAHDGAEMAVLVVAFALFVLVGKGLGCRELRYRL